MTSDRSVKSGVPSGQAKVRPEQIMAGVGAGMCGSRWTKDLQNRNETPGMP
jgi:hypothetical protein